MYYVYVYSNIIYVSNLYYILNYTSIYVAVFYFHIENIYIYLSIYI